MCRRAGELNWRGQGVYCPNCSGDKEAVLFLKQDVLVERVLYLPLEGSISKMWWAGWEESESIVFRLWRTWKYFHWWLGTNEVEDAVLCCIAWVGWEKNLLWLALLKMRSVFMDQLSVLHVCIYVKLPCYWFLQKCIVVVCLITEIDFVLDVLSWILLSIHQVTEWVSLLLVNESNDGCFVRIFEYFDRNIYLSYMELPEFLHKLVI